MSEKDSQSNKTLAKIIGALVPLGGGSALFLNSYISKIENLETKIAKQEVQIYYIEKHIDELNQFKQWCEKMYERTRWRTLRGNERNGKQD